MVLPRPTEPETIEPSKHPDVEFTVTTQEVADAYGVTTATVVNWLDAGILEGRRLARNTVRIGTNYRERIKAHHDRTTEQAAAAKADKRARTRKADVEARRRVNGAA